MNVDINLILVIILAVSIMANVCISYMGYKLFQMVLRAISPSLRHPRPGGTEPMPHLGIWGSTNGRQATDQLEGLGR